MPRDPGDDGHKAAEWVERQQPLSAGIEDARRCASRVACACNWRPHAVLLLQLCTLARLLPPQARMVTHAMPMMRDPLTPMYSRMHMRKPPEMPSHMAGDRICRQAAEAGAP